MATLIYQLTISCFCSLFVKTLCKLTFTYLIFRDKSKYDDIFNTLEQQNGKITGEILVKNNFSLKYNFPRPSSKRWTCQVQAVKQCSWQDLETCWPWPRWSLGQWRVCPRHAPYKSEVRRISDSWRTPCAFNSSKSKGWRLDQGFIVDKYVYNWDYFRSKDT